MTVIDISYCGEVIRNIGAKLHENSKKDNRFSTLEETFNEVHRMNDWVLNTLKNAFSEKYPAIPWSDSEFIIENQRNVEFEGEYWVCDPLDGALHYIQGFTFFSLSLCLVRNGRPAVSFVYDPCSHELFHAVAGEGAFLNERPIHVSRKPDLSYAYLTTSLPSNPALDAKTAQMTVRAIGQLMDKTLAVKMLGSVSLQLAYVACGRLDGYWEFGDDYYDWLAGSLLVHEAGGKLSDGRGNPFTWGTSGIIAAQEHVFKLMVEELKVIQA